MNNRILYDFEGFRVDSAQSCLWRDEEIVSLTPKAFETLLVLVKNQGQVISKDSLLDEIWKDTYVGEATLAQNISTLRKTFSKYVKGKEFIETIPRRGYRFVADVTEILTDEEVVVLEKRSVTHIVAEQELVEDEKETAAEPVSQAEIRPASSGKFSFGARRPALAFAGVIALVGLLGFLAFSYFFRPESFYAGKFQNFHSSTVFSDSDIQGVSVSPDGKYMTVIKKDRSGDRLLLKQISDGNVVEVLPESSRAITGATFSPGGNYIYYTAYPAGDEPGSRMGSLYKVPLLGGASREVLSDIDSPAAISPDDKKIAFIRNNPPERKSALIICDIDGSNEKELGVRQLPNGFSLHGLSFSPDGKLLSTVVDDRDDEKTPVKILLVDAETGEQTPLTRQSWIWIGQTSWLSDGSGIAFVAFGSKSPNLTDEIWFVSYPDGETRRITNGINGISGISLTTDADSVVADKLTRITTLFNGPLDDLDQSTEITKSVKEESLLQLGADWVADEKIVFSKTDNGNADVWIMNADGSGRKQLTSDESADFGPAVSLSENYIFYLSNRDGRMNIWRMNLNGENQIRLTDARNAYPPSVSASDGLIYFSAKAPDKMYNVLYQMDFDGKNLRQITDDRTYSPKVSPDGKHILCYYPDAEGKSKTQLPPLRMTLLSPDGKVVKQFDSLKNSRLNLIEWKRDGRGFLFVRSGEDSTIWEQPIDGKEPFKLKGWPTGNVYQISVSNDGKRLFYEKGEEVNSIIRLESQR
ncbi:MAG: winged helix-turn-helix domain-containing protein [Pyrinomonadaceae bacterium]